MFVLFGGLIKHRKYVSMKAESSALMKFILLLKHEVSKISNLKVIKLDGQAFIEYSSFLSETN